MKKINKKLATACILSVMCAGFTSLGYAAEEKTQKEEIQSFALDEYVVTANRTEQTIFNANANISVVTSADIERMQYDSLDKALTAVPGVQFQNYGGSPGLNSNMTAPVMINGSKNVLILIDGVRMTPVGGGDRAINMNLINNLDNVERIEVLKGAAGVLYGSDAAGGVINIITKKGNDNKTTLKASTGSFGKKNYHFSNSGTEGVISWNVYYDEDERGDFKDGHGREWESKFNSHAGGANVTANINDKHKISVSYNESKSDFRGTDPFNYFVPDGMFNPDYEGYQKTKGNNYTQDTTLSYELNFDEKTSNKLTYRTERYNMDYFEDYNGTFVGQPNLGNKYKTSVLSNQFTKRFDDKHTMIAGFDFTKSENLPMNQNYIIYGWRNVKNKSYFIQDTWTFDEKWNATAGVRYDESEANGTNKKNVASKSYKVEDNLSKSLNIAYNFDDRNNIYVSYDDYFIVPSASELFDATYGNDGLDPAKGKNYSIGYNHIINDNSNISVHAFQRRADVSIGLAGLSQADAKYANFENAKDTGFDIQYNKRFDENWSSFIGYSFLKHTSDADAANDRIKLGYLPRHTVNLGVKYQNDKLDVGLTGRALLSRDDSESTLSSSALDGGWPNSHYLILDLGVNYQATKNVKLFAVANNLLDVWYAESAIQAIEGLNHARPGDIYSMPGRSFVAGVEVSF